MWFCLNLACIALFLWLAPSTERIIEPVPAEAAE